MNLINIFTDKPIIPSTLLGLLSIIAGYIYYYQKGRERNKVEQLRAMPASQRLDALNSLINELGIQIPVNDLDTTQRFDLVKRMMRLRTTRWLITSITFLLLALIVAYLVSHNSQNTSTEKLVEQNNSENVKTFDLSSGRPSDNIDRLANMISEKDFQNVINITSKEITEDRSGVSVIYLPYAVLAYEKLNKITEAINKINEIKKSIQVDIQKGSGFTSSPQGIQSLQYYISKTLPYLTNKQVIEEYNKLDEFMKQQSGSVKNDIANYISQLKQNPDADVPTNNNISSGLRQYVIEQGKVGNFDSLYNFYTYMAKTNQSGVQYLTYPIIAISFLKDNKKNKFYQINSELKSGIQTSAFLHGYGGTILSEELSDLKRSIHEHKYASSIDSLLDLVK